MRAGENRLLVENCRQVADDPSDMSIRTLTRYFVAPVLGVCVGASALADEATKYVPPAIKPEDILPGEIKQFRFAESKLFRGTVRDVTIFIPAQYDGKQPACVYVK